jgi:hypothetical protein
MFEIEPMHSATHQEEIWLTLAAGADSKPQPIFCVTYATKTLFRKKRAAYELRIDAAKRTQSKEVRRRINELACHTPIYKPVGN